MSKKSDKETHELIEGLRAKIKELEQEVSTLKGRLDGLRKAKNTTITKREREVLEVGFKRDPHYEAKIEELEKKLREKSAAHAKEIEDLKKHHSDELQATEKKQKELQRQLDDLLKRLETERKDLLDKLEKQKKEGVSNNDAELNKLRLKISLLEGDNAALLVENADLKERVNSLHLELSVKEAKWCEKEEQYKLKLKQQWGDKYEEWMRETETKIQELQETNTMLRTYLHRSGQRLPDNPGGQGT